jgi:hypothetical protein
MARWSNAVPEKNLVAYRLLYVIEVGLRELIIDTLEAKSGALWWKHRLPGDVLKTFRAGREYERRTDWSQHVPHHPIYYLDFPELRQVIERADNWEDVFKKVFRRKEVLIGTLQELEPIRNRVAHNRKVSAGQLIMVEGAYQKISGAIGETRLLSLAQRCTSARDIPHRLGLLRQEADAAHQTCTLCKPLKPLLVWRAVIEEWWFDQDYLGCDLAPIQDYFETLEEYQRLPRHRGCGPSLQAWLRTSGVRARHAAAVEAFCVLGVEREAVQ